MKKRAITSIFIVLAIAVYFVFGSLYVAQNQAWSGYVFLIMTSGLLTAFIFEVTNLYNIKKFRSFFVIYSTLLALLILWFPARGNLDFVPYSTKIGWYEPWMTSVIIFFVFINCMFLPIIFKELTWLNAFILFIGLIYFSFACKSLNYFMLTPSYGWTTMLFVFLITIISDTFAYIGGKLLGKHKLAPTISPNKTIEGSLIGFICAVGVSMILTVILSKTNQNIPFNYVVESSHTSLKYILIFIIAIILSLISQLGDLGFSAIKRRLKIKDFSNILPGHGGFLDRFDSLSLVLIVSLIISAI